jgi:hypothetical protein
MSNGKDLFLRKHGKVPRKDITFGTAERVYGYYRDHHNTTGTVPVPVPATQTGNAHLCPDAARLQSNTSHPVGLISQAGRRSSETKIVDPIAAWSPIGSHCSHQSREKNELQSEPSMRNNEYMESEVTLYEHINALESLRSIRLFYIQLWRRICLCR